MLNYQRVAAFFFQARVREGNPRKYGLLGSSISAFGWLGMTSRSHHSQHWTICKAILGSGVPVTKVEILVRVIGTPYPNFWLYTWIYMDIATNRNLNCSHFLDRGWQGAGGRAGAWKGWSGGEPSRGPTSIRHRIVWIYSNSDSNSGNSNWRVSKFQSLT